MWYVLQLEAYITEREGDRTLLDMAKGKIYALVEFFKKYENSDGLLSKAGRWVLIDYSRSDELTQDINYPLNMLYSKMLKAVGNLYEDESMKVKAQTLASVILEKSFDGQWFCDNAVYDESGVARNSGECTEACQYYAFFCGIVSEKTHPLLWKRLVNDFGPSRNVSGCYPEIAKANIFLGYMIRLYLLADAGKNDKAIEDIRLYFRHMAEMTETLWEYDEPTHSLNHGFTSFVAAIIKKCLYAQA
jgi:alpha-L-rhamnosidase